MKTVLPLISIIIPVYNEQEHISQCLSSLFEQTYLPLEILVVDDGSYDQTLTCVQTVFKQAPSHIRTKLLQQKHLGPGTARNKAASKAQGEILVFVDADMTFDPKFIDKLTLPIRQGKTIGTFSKDEYVANSENPWAQAWSLLRGFAPNRMHPKNYPDQQPVYRSVRRDNFNTIGGFDTSRGYDDDWSLADRLGQLAQAAPGAKFYHSNPASLGEIYAQAKWVSKRQYKYNLFGKLITLVKLNPIFSLIRGSLLALKHRQLHLILAQLVYDMGQSLGLLEFLLLNKKHK